MRLRHIHGDRVLPSSNGPGYLARTYSSLHLIVGWASHWGQLIPTYDRDAALHILWAVAAQAAERKAA